MPHVSFFPSIEAEDCSGYYNNAHGRPLLHLHPCPVWPALPASIWLCPRPLPISSLVLKRKQPSPAFLPLATPEAMPEWHASNM